MDEIIHGHGALHGEDPYSVDSAGSTPGITPGLSLVNWSEGAPASQGDTGLGGSHDLVAGSRGDIDQPVVVSLDPMESPEGLAGSSGSVNDEGQHAGGVAPDRHGPLFGSYGGYPTKDEYNAAWDRFEREVHDS